MGPVRVGVLLHEHRPRYQPGADRVEVAHRPTGQRREIATRPGRITPEPEHDRTTAPVPDADLPPAAAPPTPVAAPIEERQPASRQASTPPRRHTSTNCGSSYGESCA